MVFFKGDEIEEGSQKRAILSSVVAEMYKVIKSLVMPKKPAEKSFKEIVVLLKEHQIPKPNKIVEKFSMRDRKEGESLSEYLAVLHC